ncbi:hypothetical protein ACJMK2_040131 [Sinanodonta woodiana]|uniref:PiggyBac transposable element-derived protein domain-containing protein n=1 Tax=Sinanodonta woodiana TaxID=1069815 RepID=A0ABD3WHI3_SINWO
MDTMKFARDELYWSENDKHWLLGSKIGKVMSRDRFFQIRHYLHFSDDRCVAEDKLHKVVVALTKPIEMKGYEVYIDNFYTSPHLADYLYQRRTYLCGTVRTNCKDYPKDLVQSNVATRKICRGTSDWLMSGPLLASYWKDNHIVYYLSPSHPPVADQTTEQRNKDGTSIELPCIHTVTDYAKYMGGVGKLDQSTRLIKEKKTMRWYGGIEIKLRVCALYNAFVLEGTVMDHSPSGTRSRDLLSFGMDVAHELIGNTHQVRRAFKRIRQLDTDEVRLDEIAIGLCQVGVLTV